MHYDRIFSIFATLSVVTVFTMKTNEFKKILNRNGCFKVNEGANHEKWISTTNGKTFFVPRHGSHEIKTGIVQAILKQAGII